MTTLVFDIECYPNFFCLNTLDIDTGVKDSYVLHEDIRDDRIGLVKFLNDGIAGKYVLIGFNSINYDTQVLTYIHSIKHTFLARSLSKALAATYRFSSKVIKSDRSPYPEWKIPFVQYDLFKIHHYDNKARTTSLKRLEFYLRWPDLRDLPYSPLHPVTREQGLDLVSYCFNDVLGTFEFWKKTLADGKIELRRKVSNEMGIHVQNASDSKIGAEIFKKYLSEDMNIDPYDLSKMRTYRKRVKLKDCILPSVHFNTPTFNKLLDYLKRQVVTQTKGVFDDVKCKYGGVEFKFGSGGLHAFGRPGIYEPKDDEVIYSVDVSSYYPNLCIVNDIRPQHLGESFSRIYKSIYEKRKAIPKSDASNLAYKLCMNSVFGKMGSVDEWLYDMQGLLTVTLNGQLLLAKLCEDLVEKHKVELLMVNTDGLELRAKRADLDAIKQTMRKWEKDTGLELEDVEYSGIVARDINNYLAITTTGKVKLKGTFEIDKEAHKDHSQRVVRIAVARYFLNGVPVQQTINEHLTKTEYEDLIIDKKPIQAHGLFDFCKMVRAKGEGKKGKAQIVLRRYEDGELVDEKLQSVNRYVVSKKGQKMAKVYNDGSASDVESGSWVVTVLNKFDPTFDDINYSYYIDQANRIITAVEGTNQLSLF